MGTVMPESNKKKKQSLDISWKQIGLYVAGAVTMVLLMKFFYHPPVSHEASAPPIHDRDKFTCRTDVAQFAPLESDILFNGTVSFDENNVIRIFPFVSGNVEDVDVSLGTYVKKGQQIAKIKSADISVIQSEYRAAQTNLELAKRNVHVVEELYKSQFSSQTDLLNAKKELEKAESQLKKTEEIVNLYGTDLSGQPYYYVKAPIEGYIVEKNINASMQIRPDNNNPMFTISDLKRVWVWVNVYEDDIAMVKEGQNVVITTMVYPGKEFNGKITNVGNVLDKESRVLKVRVELDNKEGLLKPDMFAAIRLHIGEPRMMLAVNPKALVFDNDHYYVVVVRNDNYEIKPVDLAKATSQFAYISKGIHEGDVVVTEGNLLVYNELLSK